ncbi:MAG TPA: hypothetical protein EYN91_04955 [Candidatus Melainabacteria bacterium]|jgi:hypothetical protein|nr:hypothetical protein [Candidatus Melainabacteria bacterium]
MKRQTFKGVIASASCLLSLQAAVPAIAQTTMLMGSATHNTAATKATTTSSVRLTPPQTPRYDYRPVAQPAPRTVYQTRTVYVKDNRTYFQRHPKVKAATIGAGVGAGAGALTGLVTGRGVLRGGAIGAGTGAGVGLVRSSTTMKRHPIIRDVATGTLVGGGLGWAGSRRRGTIAKTAGVGAALGLGVGLFKHLQ